MEGVVVELRRRSAEFSGQRPVEGPRNQGICLLESPGMHGDSSLAGQEVNIQQKTAKVSPTLLDPCPIS